MFSRYINLPEKTAAEFSGGFFKTGDIAARERIGNGAVYFKILGRASMVVAIHMQHSTQKRHANESDDAAQDIIKRGGHKISALEIERVGDFFFHKLQLELRADFHTSANRNFWSIHTSLLLQCAA